MIYFKILVSKSYNYTALPSNSNNVLYCFLDFCGNPVGATYRFLKVFQAEFIWFGEELSLVHAANVENDVGSLGHLVALDDVVCQSSAHREVHDGMEAQRFIDAALQHCQALQVCIPQGLFSC